MQEKKFIFVKAKPLVTIITLNWNQTEVTCQFLESARKLLYKNHEIIVCDLGSASDPTPQILAGNYPNTRILKIDSHSNENGVNRAINQANGDFILLINNYNELTENTLDDLLAPFLSDKLLGVTCPKVRSYHKKNEIQFAGYHALNILTGRNSIIGHKKQDNGQYDSPNYTHGAYSGAMMFKKNVIVQAGMFPGNFFTYFDDRDVSTRILKTGYKILYQPKAVVYNKKGGFPSNKNAINVYYNTRNRIFFMRKNCSLWHLSIFLFFFLLLTIPAAILKYLIKGQMSHLNSFFKGIWWNIKIKPVF